MFPSHQILENSQNGAPAPTCTLKWLPCGEWFGIPEEQGLFYPFLKLSCNNLVSVCLNPQDQLIEVSPELEIVRIIPETVTFQTSSLL
jgi:hypothetical protein